MAGIMTLIVWLVLFAGFGTAFYFVRSKGLAFVVCSLVHSLLSKHIKSFHLSEFSIYPFVMKDFEITIRGTKKQPEASVSFKSFKILLYFNNLFTPLLEFFNFVCETNESTMSAHKIICFELVDFDASSPNLKFADLLNPPENKKATVYPNPYYLPPASIAYTLPFAAQKIAQYFLLFVEIKFVSFHFEFTMPSHGNIIEGFASEMIICFPPSSTNPTNKESIQVKMGISGGVMDITQSGKRAMLYSGKYGVMRVEMHMPTGIMDVSATLFGRDDDMEVHIQPMLEFLTIYQTAEDNMIEIKLAKGIAIASKMTMNVDFSYMKIGIYDTRCANIVIMQLHKISAGLQSFKLSVDGQRTYQNAVVGAAQSAAAAEAKCAEEKKPSGFRAILADWQQHMNKNLGVAAPVLMTTNIEKVMRASFAKVEFMLHPHYSSSSTTGGGLAGTTSVAIIESGSMLKCLHVQNSGTFIDDDHMSIAVQTVQLQRVTSSFLDWLFALQDASNVMPVCRFAHMKQSEIRINVGDLLFSTQPGAFHYDVVNHNKVTAPWVPNAAAIHQAQQQQQHQQSDAQSPTNNAPDVGSEGDDSPSNHLPNTLDNIVPIDDNRLVTFRMQNMAVKKVAILNTLDSDFVVNFGTFTINTALPTSELEYQYALTVGEREDEVVDSFSTGTSLPLAQGDSNRDLSRINSQKQLNQLSRTGSSHLQGSTSSHDLLSPIKMNQSAAKEEVRGDNDELAGPLHFMETGTKWTFDKFTADFRMGAKLALHSVQAEHFSVDFTNSIYIHTTHSVALTRPVEHKDLKGSVPVVPVKNIVTTTVTHLPTHNFFTTDKLHAVWTGQDIHADLGDNVRINASAAGAVKALCGFNMIKKTGDRVSVRMEYVKALGILHSTVKDPHPAVPAAIVVEQQHHNSDHHSAHSEDRSHHHHHHHRHHHHHHRSHHKHDTPSQHQNAAPVSTAAMAVQFSAIIEFAFETPNVLVDQTRVLPALTPPISPKSPLGGSAAGGAGGGLSPKSRRPVFTRAHSVVKDDTTNEFVSHRKHKSDPQVTHNRRMIINLDSLHLKQVGSDMTVEFVSCTMQLSNYIDKNFLNIEHFSYSKETVPFDSEHATSANYHSSSARFDTLAAATTMSLLTIKMETFEVGMCEQMDLGTAIDALSLQAAAYSAVNNIANSHNNGEGNNGMDAGENSEHLIYDLSEFVDTEIENEDEAEVAFDEIYGAETSFDADHTGNSRSVASISRSDSESVSSESGTDNSDTEEEDITQQFSPVAVDTSLPLDSPAAPHAPSTPHLMLRAHTHVHDNNGVFNTDQFSDAELTDALFVPPANNKNDPFVAQVNIGRFAVNVDAEYQGAGEPVSNFFSFQMCNLDVHLDGTKENSAVQDDIANYDFGYEGANGIGGHDRSDSTAGHAHSILPNNNRHLSGCSNVSNHTDVNGLPDSYIPDFVMYQGISGGAVTCKIETMSFIFSPLAEPYVRLSNIVYSGSMYNAGVSDPRIPLEYDVLTLADTVPNTLYQCADKSIDPDKLPTFNINPLYTIHCKNIAPGKVYLDLEMSCGLMEVNQYPETAECIAAVTAALEVCLPPNKDPSTELPLWDNMRFWLHGEFDFSANRMVFTQFTHDYMSKKVTLFVILENMQFCIDRNSFEFTATNVAVQAEITTKLLAKRGAKAKSNKVSNSVKTTIVTIPGIVLALKHKYLLVSQSHPYHAAAEQHAHLSKRHSDAANLDNNVDSFPYSHHDVYLKPAFYSSKKHTHGAATTPGTTSKLNSAYTAPKTAKYRTVHLHKETESSGRFLLDFLKDMPEYQFDDRFYHFRSKRMQTLWTVECRIADTRKASIVVNLRLDHMIRILDAFQQPPQRPETPTSFGVPADVPVSAAGHKVSPYKMVVKPKSSVTVGDIISRLDMQMIVNKLVVSSWASGSNLGGIVFQQELIDVQLRCLRDTTNAMSGTVVSGNSSSRKSSKEKKQSVSAQKNKNMHENVPEYPLIIDHLFTEIYFVELFVRDWNLCETTDSSKNNETTYTQQTTDDSTPSRQPTKSMEIVEPTTVSELASLYTNIYKLAHTSKVVVSLTESGEVSARCNTFQESGILHRHHYHGPNGAVVPPPTLSRKASGSAAEFAMNNNSSKGIPTRKPFQSVGAAAEALNYGEDLNDDSDFGNEKTASGKGGVNPDRFCIGREWRRITYGGLPSATSNNKGRMSLRMSQLQRNRSSGLPTTTTSSNPNRRASTGVLKVSTGGGGTLELKDPASLVTPLRRQSQAFLNLPKKERSNSIDATTGSVVSPLRTGTRKGSVLSVPTKVKVAHVWDPAVDGYRASLRSFAANHSAFTPPADALPESYKGARTSKRLSDKQLSAFSFDATNRTKVAGRVAEETEDESSFGNKKWGLRVVDIRLLFTIETRDVLFTYVSRCIDLFATDNSPAPISPEVSAKGVSGRGGPEGAVASRRPSSLRMGPTNGPSVKASLEDFLHKESKSGKQHATKSNRSSVTNASDGENSPVAASDDDSSQITSAEPSSPGHNHLSPDHEMRIIMGEIDKRAIPKELLDDGHPHFQRGGRQLGRQRGVSIRRGSLYNRSIEDEAKEQLENEDEEQAPQLATSGPVGFASHLSVANPAVKLPSPIQISSVPASHGHTPKRSSSVKTPKSTRKKPHQVYQTFFVIELIDPQVNFLDVKTHSSLIIVAGNSTLEGKRLNAATLPLHGADAKRKQEIRLRMDGVSAFTVPTIDTDDGDMDAEIDAVHWKIMKNTTDVMVLPNKRTIDHSTLRFDGRDATESRFMKTAIKDFQIRALYIFWTDVTVAEAKRMFVSPVKEDMVCSFKLELPDICVDILSWQFYIIMNVVRNVLLVPPPAMKNTGKSSQQESDESNEHKYLEITRNPALLEKHGMKVNLNHQLDLNHKYSRDEVKILIEESLTNVLELYPGTARFVEVYIGKCTWILRTEKKDNVAGGLVETGFIGIYATMTFGEDRTLTSLFEIQRFWARNQEPGQDTTQFTDKNTIMMPVLADNNEVCSRCGAEFKLDSNNSNACTFHADTDGNPGVYKDAVVVDELTKQAVTHKQWSCCGRHHEYAAGCSARPHICKEVMISIRAETNPPTRVESIEVSVIKSFEISIFPGATYDLQMQFTKNLSTVLHRYFAVEAIDFDNFKSEESTSTGLDSASSQVTPTDTTDSAATLELGEDGHKKKKSLFRKLMGPKRRASVDSASLDAANETSAKPHRGSVGEKTQSTRGSFALWGDSKTKDTAADGATSIKRSASFRHKSVGGSSEKTTTVGSMRHHLSMSHSEYSQKTKPVVVKKKYQEGVYLQYFRVGVINMDVTTSGFTINLEKFKAVMEEYVCRKELLDWKKLIYLLEKHLVVSLFKHTANNSLARLGKFLHIHHTTTLADAASGHHRRNTVPGLLNYVDPNEDSEEIKAAKRAMILGLPVTNSFGNGALTRMRKTQLHHSEMLMGIPKGMLHPSRHNENEESSPHSSLQSSVQSSVASTPNVTPRQDGKQRDSFLTVNTSAPAVETGRSNSITGGISPGKFLLSPTKFFKKNDK